PPISPLSLHDALPIYGKLQPLRTELRNGDIVEIVTAPNHAPSPDWLTFVKTPRARTKIRQWLNVDRRNRSIDLGKTVSDREFKRSEEHTSELQSRFDL